MSFWILQFNFGITVVKRNIYSQILWNKTWPSRTATTRSSFVGVYHKCNFRFGSTAFVNISMFITQLKCFVLIPPSKSLPHSNFSLLCDRSCLESSIIFKNLLHSSLLEVTKFPCWEMSMNKPQYRRLLSSKDHSKLAWHTSMLEVCLQFFDHYVSQYLLIYTIYYLTF